MSVNINGDRVKGEGYAERSVLTGFQVAFCVWLVGFGRFIHECVRGRIVSVGGCRAWAVRLPENVGAVKFGKAFSARLHTPIGKRRRVSGSLYCVQGVIVPGSAAIRLGFAVGRRGQHLPRA